jgi:tRNA(Ile)-lysidine synthetase-like protein
MKIQLIQAASKESFKTLKNLSPLYCQSLNALVHVNRLFYNHISFNNPKKRSVKEVKERLMIIPLIKKILTIGVLQSQRQEKEFSYYEIKYQEKQLDIRVILSQKKDTIYLLSCFLNTKKESPISPVDGSSRSIKHQGHFYSKNTTIDQRSKSKHDLKNIFQQFLVEQDLVDKKILLAVSGGVDSMVLFNVAQQSIEAKNLAVFHVNHGTRAQNETEQNFLEDSCIQKNITWHGYAINAQPTKNKENSWRQTRKNLAIDAQKKFGADRTLTAHHATDLVETMIFRLTKGAGPSGMSPFDTTTKPFWQVPKKNLLHYAQHNELTWFEDASNEDTKYQRNLIRQKILPALREITPNLEKVFVKEATLFGQLDDYVQSTVKKILNKYQSRPQSEDAVTLINSKLNSAAAPTRSSIKYKIPLTEFLDWEVIIQRSVLRNIAGTKPSSAEIDDCLRWICGKPRGGSEKKIGAKKIVINKNNIYF